MPEQRSYINNSSAKGKDKTIEKTTRLLIVDILRGFAISLMILFHFCFDLTYFGIASFDFYNNSFWLYFRTFILSLFLLLVGVSLWLSYNKKMLLEKFFKRTGVILVNAILVSLVTGYMFGDRIVFFGVLHFIALASVVSLLFVPHRHISLLLGVLILFTNFYEHSWFDQPLHQWLGMMTYKPTTQDYVPMFPWLGVILIGIYIAPFITSLNSSMTQNSYPSRFLALMGKHSLLIYMAHQPILMGLMSLPMLWG